MREQIRLFLMGCFNAVAALFRSRKFLLALFAVVQTILFTLRPDINQDIWKAIDALVAILIAAIAHEDAAAKSAGAATSSVSAATTPKDFLSSLGVAVFDTPNGFKLAGATNVYDKGAGVEIFLYGANGQPIQGATIVGLFPDGNGFDPVTTSASGRAEFDFGASSAYNPPAKGPIKILVSDRAGKNDEKRVVYGAVLSDIVDGLGDVEGHHTFWSLQFTAPAAPVVKPPVEIPVLAGPLEASLRSLAWQKRGISWNPDAALYKIARQKAMGYPLGDEFNFKDAGGTLYVAQLFANGIVYCVVGDWANVYIVAWL